MSFQFGNSLSLIWKKLKKGDYTVRPFEVYKLWNFNTDSGSRDYYGNHGINVYRSLYPENHKYYGNVATISSSLYDRVFTSQSLDPKILWYYLDHVYYTDESKEKDPALLAEFERKLYLAESSSVMIMPRGVFGEGIRRGSFNLANLHADSSSLRYSIVDDSKGNLKDASFVESNFVDEQFSYLYIGFNEKYREYEFRNKQFEYVLDTSPKKNNVSIIRPKQISYHSGIPTTDTSQSSGTSVALNGGYFEVRPSQNFNFNKGNAFAFSFWVNVPPTQSDENSSYNYLFNKNYSIDGDYEYVPKTGRGTSNQYIAKRSSQYPFDITFNNRTSGNPFSISFKQSSGKETNEVISSALNPGQWYHVVCQKSSSYYQIWLDGTLDSVVTASVSEGTTNENNFFIGSNGTNTGTFSGSLDEIRVYKKGLSSNEISYLSNNSFQNGYAYQTARIGNIFYKSGTVVVSDPRPKYANAMMGQFGNFDYGGTSYGFTGSFRSTTTFYEHEVICKIRRSEYNFTLNPSIRKDKDPYADTAEDYVTSSFFNPYITTIGLYNENRDLVAVAKLASPLEKRDDVDMNIIIRWDV